MKSENAKLTNEAADNALEVFRLQVPALRDASRNVCYVTLYVWTAGEMKKEKKRGRGAWIYGGGRGGVGCA